ncbi:MAG: hypothetical protein O7G85_06565, partial [Planctomycetota bacterium]|nr:hypothetical protein [Planctomycetota bacterium]
AEPQSGELFLASLDEGHLATGRFIDQLRRDAPQQTEAIRTCLLAFGIERSRRTAGLSLSAGRYKYLVPRFFTGLLSSGLDEKQVLELATREVRLLAAKTLAHQRLILEEFNTLRILLQQIGQDRDEEDYQAIEAQQQALSEMALALVEDLWSGVDRIARGLPDPERQAYMAWIINDLGGEWAGNPATWCMEAGATLIEQDSDLLKSLQSIEARITGLEAKIIRKNARAALANEASQERIVRDFHALGDARLRLLGDLATLLRSTHDGVGAENLPPQWQLIEMIDSRPRAVWRTLHDSIDRVIRVTDGEDEE